ncbi:MAG: YicC family protein [Parachlamydia sp.]|nr:YicC family protein [Parachlamydia sp.]
MTAYGRASLNAEMGHFTLEIQSVNKKFLEINVSLPRELSYFDPEIKKWLYPALSRGQLSVKVTASFGGKAPFVVIANIALAKQMKTAWQKIAQELEIKEEFSMGWLSQADDLLKFEENRQEEEGYRQVLKGLLHQALTNFMEMKMQEGAVLQTDILSRITKVRQAIHLIEKKTPDATKKYREKLLTRLEEFMPAGSEHDERILREVALFAEKIDITEEITRFECHLDRLEEMILGTESTIGKTLEFILQELGREINTIGSKSSDIEIASLVISVKSELEKIREQIQNVE